MIWKHFFAVSKSFAKIFIMPFALDLPVPNFVKEKKKNSSSKAVTSMISCVYKFMTRSLKYPGMETEINLPNKRDSCTILWSNIYSENWSFPMFPPTFRVLVWFKAVLLEICKFWRWIMELKFCRALKIIPLNWRMCKKWGCNTIILFLE